MQQNEDGASWERYNPGILNQSFAEYHPGLTQYCTSSASRDLRLWFLEGLLCKCQYIAAMNYAEGDLEIWRSWLTSKQSLEPITLVLSTQDDICTAALLPQYTSSVHFRTIPFLWSPSWLYISEGEGLAGRCAILHSHRIPVSASWTYNVRALTSASYTEFAMLNAQWSVSLKST